MAKNAEVASKKVSLSKDRNFLDKKGYCCLHSTITMKFSSNNSSNLVKLLQ